MATHTHMTSTLEGEKPDVIPDDYDKIQDNYYSPITAQKVVTAIPQYEHAHTREPYAPADHEEYMRMKNPGTAHANLAPSTTAPDGTLSDNWAQRHKNQTVLQQHCEFFDSDGDGIIWPLDTYRGFREIGFNIALSLFAMFIIHLSFSYPSCPGILPDPFFRLFLNNIHKSKHGSDTGSYDNEGSFIPQRFEDFFRKYGGGKDALTKWDIWNGVSAQRVILDPIGWCAEILEWTATYIFLWPEDGMVRKEDARRVYDGSIWYEAAQKRKQTLKQQKAQ